MKVDYQLWELQRKVGRRKGMSANEYKVSFLGDENTLN